MNKTVTMVIAGIIAAGLMVVASYTNNAWAQVAGTTGGSTGNAGSSTSATGGQDTPLGNTIGSSTSASGSTTSAGSAGVGVQVNDNAGHAKCSASVGACTSTP